MKNFFKKNKNIIFIVAILGCLIGLISWQILQPNGLSKDFVSGNGRIEANEIDLATKLGGRLIDVFVEEGELVKKDQILAQMQTDILEAQLEEVKAKYRQAAKMVDTVMAQIIVAENNSAAMKSIAKQREAELDVANKRLARSQHLAKSDAISKQILDDDRAQAKSAAAALQAAEAQSAASEATIAATKAELNGAHATVEAYLANIKRITVEINDSQLKAPCTAKVQYRIAQPGETLGAGGKVLSLVDLRNIHMTFFLPETVAGKIAMGTEVRIVLDAATNHVIPAKVSFISSVAQFTPKTVETASERQKLMFRVKARIDQTLVERNLDQVKTGVPGEAFIKLNPQTPWPRELMLQTEKNG